MGDVEKGANSDCQWKKGKGGFKACSFIFVLTSLDNLGFIANMVSMYLYFHSVMDFDIPNSANTLTNFLGSTFLLTTVSGFISDTYLNRFYTILIFGLIETLALVLMTLQAKLQNLHPPYCGEATCVEGGVAAMLYASLCLLALGAGGVRGALPSLGADQFDQDDPEEAKSLGSYFNWLTLFTVLGASVGVTCVVWLMIYRGWYKGFIVSSVGTFVGLVVLAFGKPFYRLRQPGESPIMRILQVLVLAAKNQRLALPKNADELYEITDKVSADKRIAHTEQFRCLDKAAICNKNSSDAGTACPVSQVEEVKILTRMLPILFSTIIMNTCLAQLQTFSVQQGYSMNLKLGGNFNVAPPSIPVIPLLFMLILIPIYEFLFVPLARKITGHPSGITELQRVGIGLVLSVISMAVAAIVEVKRRNQSIKDSAHPISVFWLSFQYGIFGIADMFTLVGLLEFFYKEAPSGMKSLSTSFTWLSLSFGYFLSTVFVNIIDAVTKRITPSKRGWINAISLNESKLDLFYWFLAVLSFLNFLNYLYWASWYKYKSSSRDDDGDGSISMPTIENKGLDPQPKEEIGTQLRSNDKQESSNTNPQERSNNEAQEPATRTQEDPAQTNAEN